MPSPRSTAGNTEAGGGERISQDHSRSRGLYFLFLGQQQTRHQHTDPRVARGQVDPLGPVPPGAPVPLSKLGSQEDSGGLSTEQWLPSHSPLGQRSTSQEGTPTAKGPHSAFIPLVGCPPPRGSVSHPRDTPGLASRAQAHGSPVRTPDRERAGTVCDMHSARARPAPCSLAGSSLSPASCTATPPHHVGCPVWGPHPSWDVPEPGAHTEASPSGSRRPSWWAPRSQLVSGPRLPAQSTWPSCDPRQETEPSGRFK